MKSIHVPLLSTLLWGGFLFWSACALVVIPFHLGSLQITEGLGESSLARTLLLLSLHFDTLWFLLAAANGYLFIVEREGLAMARRRALTLLGGVTALVLLGATTGVPFGPYVYSERLGTRLLGILPGAVPFLWFTLLLGSAYTARALAGGNARAGILLTGLLTLLADLNLEPVAWRIRYYWFWYWGEATPPAWPPFANFMSWLGVGLFCGILFYRKMPPPGPALRLSARPVLAFAAINAVFLLAHMARAAGWVWK